MSLQNAVNVTLAYGPETTFGVAAATNAGKLLRRVSSSLATTKEAFASNEVRPDQQVSDLRHGMRRASGGFEGELSLQTYDDLIEALLRGTWASGVSLSETGLTSVVASASAKTFTFTGGDPVSIGLRVGDVIRFSGLTPTTNNGKNFRITGFGGTSNRTVSVHPAPADVSTPDTSFGVSVVGKKLLMGTERRSFTIQQHMEEIDITELFTGCRVGTSSFQMPPNGMATASFEVLGKDGQVLTGVNAPYFISPTVAPNTAILTAVSGSMRLAGVERSVVTGLDFQVALNLSSQPVVGAQTAPEVFYGRSVVTGNVSAYLEDESLINVFLNEEEVDIQAVMESGTSVGLDFLSFKFSRVKLSGASKTIGPDGGVIATFPFQALLPSAAGQDASSLVIQRSNV